MVQGDLNHAAVFLKLGHVSFAMFTSGVGLENGLLALFTFKKAQRERSPKLSNLGGEVVELEHNLLPFCQILLSEWKVE